MDFIERIQSLAKKIQQQSASITTEEATKNAFIMPFLHTVLGYDVFDPTEVIPEFTADTGIKKGEKVDYAIVRDNDVQILIECKKYGDPLSTKHSGQLFRYFAVTNARIAILTNGAQYEFYTDIDAPNKMDEKPFLILNLEDIDEYIIPEIKKLTKVSFDVESIIGAAGELKYLSQIKRILQDQFKEPEEDFVKFFASRSYDGIITAKVKKLFTEITSKALVQFLNDAVNERLKNAIDSSSLASTDTSATSNETLSKESKLTTTDEETQAFNIIKAILRREFEVSRIIARDTQSYFGVLLDDNNRKPLCRLWLNAKQKYLGLFDSEKKETKYPLSSIDSIYDLSDLLLTTTAIYKTEQAEHK